MAIKLTLNPKNDQLVPIEALQDWSNKYLDLEQEANWVKKLFSGKEGKVKRERIGEINNVIKNLKTSGSNRAWFIKVFLKPWGGKATDEAKLIFDALSDDKAFDELQQAAEDFQGKLKVATTEAAKAAAALTDIISNDSKGLAPIAANFAKAFNSVNTAKPAAPATQPAPVDAVKSQSAFEKALVANKNQPITKPQWMKALWDELKAPAASAGGTVTTTPAVGGTASAGAPLKESSIVDRFKMDKKLYEAGLIERSEYLASVLDVRNHLNEGAREANRTRGGRGPGGGGGRGKGKRGETKAGQPPPAGGGTASVTNPPASDAPAADVSGLEPRPAATAPVAVPAETEESLQAKLDAIGLKKDVIDAEWDRLSRLPQNMSFIVQPAAPAPTTENINKSFMLTKRLYEAGLIDRSEYLAALVKTKKVLAEQPSGGSAPTSAPAATAGVSPQGGAAAQQGPDPAIEPIGKAISTIIGVNADTGAFGALLKQSSALQDALTKIGQEQVAESALTAKQQQLAKLYFKKQVLSEYAKTGEVANKIQLNEFFLTALLLSALAGAIAWATSKLSGFFKDSYTGYSSSYDTPSGNPQQQVVNVTNGIGAGMDADGNLVDGSGNKVANFQATIQEYTKAFNAPADAISKAVADINANVPKLAAPANALKDFESFKAFQIAFQRAPNEQITALFAKLNAIKDAL